MIAGSSYILHKNIIDKYDEIFFKHLEKMLTFKNSINNSLIIDDQQVYGHKYTLRIINYLILYPDLMDKY